MDYNPPDANPQEEMALWPPEQNEIDSPAAAGDHPLPLNGEDLEDALPLTPLPLLLEDTLEVIFRRLHSFEHLKMLRLVNSTWNRVATRLLKSRSRGSWIHFSRTRTLRDMQRLNDMITTPPNWVLPCTKFEIDTLYFSRRLLEDPPYPNDGEKQEVVETFFRGVAPFVKELSLFIYMASEELGVPCLFPVAPPPTDIHFPLLEKVSFVLRRLPTRNGQTTSSTILETSLTFMRGILRNSPRLVEVQSGHEHRVSSVLDAFYELQCLDHLSSLRRLTILVDMPVVQPFRLLAQMEAVRHLRLREFHLTFKNSTHRPEDGISEAIYQFLGVQRDSLEILVVEVRVESEFPIRIPVLDQLKTLRLWPSSCPVSIEHSFPALQYFMLMGYPPYPFNFAVIAQPMKALTAAVLDLSKSYGLFDDHRPIDYFRDVARVLPNLKKLTLYSFWGTINLHDLAPLQSLRELTLPCLDSRDNQGDLMLTGYSADELGVWKTLSAEALKSESQTARDPPLILLRLRKLAIDCSNRNGAYISDLSARLVFLRLPNLTCLDLRGCKLGPPGISAQVLAEMRAKFSVLPLHRPLP